MKLKFAKGTVLEIRKMKKGQFEQIYAWGEEKWAKGGVGKGNAGLGGIELRRDGERRMGMEFEMRETTSIKIELIGKFVPESNILS